MRILSVGIVRARDDSCNNAMLFADGGDLPNRMLGHLVVADGNDSAPAGRVSRTSWRVSPMLDRGPHTHDPPDDFLHSRHTIFISSSVATRRRLSGAQNPRLGARHRRLYPDPWGIMG